MVWKTFETTPEQKEERKLEEYRLRATGEWEEANAFRLSVYHECKAKMGLPAALEYAFQEMKRNYPPKAPPVSEPEEAEPTEGEETNEALPAESVVAGVRKVGTVVIPGEWPEFGPSDIRKDVQWVYDNFVAIMPTSPGKRIRLDRALTAAPSAGAIGWAINALGNRNKFYEVTYPKICGGIMDKDDSEEVRREKSRIEDMKRILEELRDDE